MSYQILEFFSFLNILFFLFFKYFIFFLDSFKLAFSAFGMELSSYSLNISLPVGISFYTFQTLSCTIDLYNKKLFRPKILYLSLPL